MFVKEGFLLHRAQAQRGPGYSKEPGHSLIMAPSHVGSLVTEEELAKSSSQLEQSEKKVKENDKFKILQNKIHKHGWRRANLENNLPCLYPGPS